MTTGSEQEGDEKITGRQDGQKEEKKEQIEENLL